MNKHIVIGEAFGASQSKWTFSLPSEPLAAHVDLLRANIDSALLLLFFDLPLMTGSAVQVRLRCRHCRNRAAYINANNLAVTSCV